MAVKFQSSGKESKKRGPQKNDLSHLSEVIMSHVGVGIYIVQDGIFVYTSPLYQKLTGYSDTELAGLDSLDYLHPDDREMTRGNAIKNLRGDRSDPYEYRFIRKNGEVMWVLEMVASIIYKGERASLGSFMDITERKRAEETLRFSDERSRTILEAIEDGYFEIDLTGTFTFVNDVICRHMRCPREELIGVNNRQFQDETNAKKTYRFFAEIYTTGKPVKAFEMEVLRKDGTRQISEVSISLVRDEEGNPIGFRGTSRDINDRKQMEETLRQSEEKYRTIIESIQEGYFELDLDGNYTFVNEVNCRFLGYTKEELVGMNTRRHTDEETLKKLYQPYRELYLTGTPIKALEVESIRKDGAKVIHETSVSLIRDSKDKPIGFRGVSRDITERKLMEETIRQSEERYRSIIEEMEEWYFETDLVGNILFFNDIFVNGLGYSRKKLAGVNFRNFVREEDIGTVYQTFHQVHETGEPTRNFPYEFVRPDGSTTFIEFSIFPKRDSEGTILGFRGVGHDITERKRTEERIEYLATHDTLTDLPNRLMFSQLLNHAIQGARRYERQLAVLFIDLDRFKIINDTLGHEAGDQLLQEVAMRLRQALRAVDVFARLGGDEFVILIEEVGDSSQVATVAHNILSTVIQPLTIMDQECRVTASVGISIYPKDAEDEQSLMKTADIAMYFAKEEGKNNYQFYSKEIKSQSIERLLIETNLRMALERKEFSLHYQAKLDFKTDAITGVEALLRWQNPTLGSVPPLQLIPVAEETGLIVPIGRWVLKTACAQNVAWQRQGLPPVCMAVNLSLRQLTDEGLLEDIKAALADSGMAANLLELEITESMVMNNPPLMIKVLSKIKKLGVRLAIDDFGTGYSSLAQIKNFPIDTLKVDRSFIRNLPNNSEDKAITEAILHMGKALSLTVVAEGVETQDQMDFLKEHACDEMQGFYFSKPIVPEQFADLLRIHAIAIERESGGTP
ncbi:MAG: PAS domain S-box protein [Deltaproteobacteria bacterium]|nr:PAS domain S-box protein [Deltaproteobacteria bacterium]